MRRLELVPFLAALSIAACGEPDPIPLDTGLRRDSARADADATMDATRDSAVDPDALPDSSSDGARPDARDSGGRLEAGPLFDIGPPPDGGPIDPCGLVVSGPTCTGDGDCGGGVCLRNGCGEMRCFAPGAQCVTSADCPSTSTCEAVSGGMHCVNPASGCTDSRDCPDGFGCESGACVDRRIACIPPHVCPFGYVCDLNRTDVAPYCRRLYRACDADGACPIGSGLCRDVVGDGSRVCMVGGPCDSNLDCPLRRVCTVEPETLIAFCHGFGPCLVDEDCPEMFECRDMFGDGIRQCTPVGGSCDSNADCPSPAICGADIPGGPASCIDRPL